MSLIFGSSKALVALTKVQKSNLVPCDNWFWVSRSRTGPQYIFSFLADGVLQNLDKLWSTGRIWNRATEIERKFQPVYVQSL